MKWGIYGGVLLAMVYSAIADGEEDDVPYLKVIPKARIYNVNEKKAIYCKGLNLKEKIEWIAPNGSVVEGRSTKNNRIFVEVVHSKDNPKESLSPLIIQSVRLEDSGNWTCKSGDLSDVMDILVGDKVIIAVRKEDLDAEEGKRVKLECPARGIPTPTVQWYKNMVPLTEEPGKYVMTKDRDETYFLEIRNLNHTDTGIYVCKVTQAMLSHFTDKTITLTVQHRPLLIDSVTHEVITTTARVEEVYAILNETKNITCSAKANPLPRYQWFRVKNHYDNPIPEQDSVFTSEDGLSSVLMLRMYNSSYLGEYKCTANNNKGHVSVVYHVNNGNKPDPPTNVTWLNATAQELVFDVRCMDCKMVEDPDIGPDPNNLKILAYSFQFTPVIEGFSVPDWDEPTEVEVDIADPEDTIFVVGPLPNSTKFYARVRSRNAAGYSEWLEISDNPATTDLAIKLTASLLVVLIAFLLAELY